MHPIGVSLREMKAPRVADASVEASYNVSSTQASKKKPGIVATT